MAPTCYRAAFRLLVSVFLFTSIASAATLPHYALDPRSPLPQVAEIPPGTVDIAPAPGSDDIKKPKTFLETISKNLQFLADLLRGVYNYRPADDEDDDDSDDADETVTTTVYITPTPIEQSSAATLEVLSGITSSASLVTPPGPLPSATLEPTPSSEEIFSILPVGPLTTAINVTLPDPELASLTSTLEPSPSSPSESAIEPPFPVNTTTASAPALTPAIITDQFTAVLPSIWSGNASAATIAPSILTNPIQPTISRSSNETVNGTSTTKVRWTTLIIVTATVVPSPVEETGTGVFTPAPNTATLLWPNTTFATPTDGVSGTVGVSAATSISNATATEAPLSPNTTFVLPTLITVTGGPGSALNVSLPVTIPPFANSTYVLPTPVSGTGSPVGAANASGSEISISQNATYVTPTALPSTGSPDPSAGTISNAPISFTDIPYFPNATVFEPTTLPGTGTAPPVVAETVTSPSGSEPNVTTIYSTTTTTLALETPTATSAPNGTNVIDSTIEFPGLLALRRLCHDPQIRVITLPLLNRFHGPSSYPSLFAFPGCIPPNDRQALQAPGLLNCSALGAEVQRCQASGRKVFLTVKGDGVEAVGGDVRFGDPRRGEKFGGYFVDVNEGVGMDGGDDGMGGRRKKRQLGRQGGGRLGRGSEDSPVVVVKPTVTAEAASSVVADALSVVETPVVLISPVVVESPVISAPSIILSTPATLDSEAVPEPTLIAEPPTIETPSIIAAPSMTSEPIIFIDPMWTEPAIISEAPATEPTTISTPSPIPLIQPYPSHNNQPTPPFPNLFDTNHPPSALALTLFSLFGEGHTERLDLRPLGQETASPAVGITSKDAIELGQTLQRLTRPLGEEVVVDGYDVQLPAQWKGSYQDAQFKELVARLRQLNREAWKASGGVEGAPGDLGADGRPEVYFGWVGEMVRGEGGG